MCSNEECDFPFAETPEHIKEVCYFFPKISSNSLSKQVCLLQEMMLDRNGTCDHQEDLDPDFEQHIRKLELFLTNYQQNCGPNCGCPAGLAQKEFDKEFNQYMNNEYDQKSSDCLAKFEKVCHTNLYNTYNMEVLDHDSYSVNNDSVDAQMEEDQPSSTLSDTDAKADYNDIVSKWLDQTNSMTQSVPE